MEKLVSGPGTAQVALEIICNKKQYKSQTNKTNVNANDFLHESIYSVDLKFVNHEEKKNNNDRSKVKIVITGDSLLNKIHEKGFSKGHQVTLSNLQSGTSERKSKIFVDMLKKKPDYLTVYA